MKVLHLFSNHKLTGPAEPVVRLAAALADRGHEVVLAHAPPPRSGDGDIVSAAQRYGVETTTEFQLPKHYRTLTILSDVRRLSGYLDENRFEVVHCHLVNDHLTGALAVGRNRSPARIVRTNHEAVAMKRGLRGSFLLPRRTDALIELSRRARRGNIERFGMPPDRVSVIDTSVEMARFDPARELPDMRAKWGLSPGHFVVGIAARIQKRRRFDVLLDAAAIARDRIPGFRLVIIGRGTHKQAVAVGPARKRGLDDIVVFPGYLRDDDYVGGLAGLDVKTFLVPGTDGSCRAAREAMALGVPLVASRRGMLPELVDDGETGLVVDDTPEGLAGAFERLARDDRLRERMGSAARQAALARFDPAEQAMRVEQVYEDVLSER